MSLLVPAAIIGGGTLLAWLAAHSEGGSDRTIMLVQGKRYAITHRIVGPGWSADLYPGFCNFTQRMITAEGNGWAEVQFMADWCAANRSFDVPSEMAITEV